MKKKILITIIVILSIICIILGCRSLRNALIIRDLKSKLEENIDKNNYYLKTTIKTGESDVVTETYYKDGVGKLVSSNGVYSWTDGKKAYMIDEENRELYTMDISDANSVFLISDRMFVSLLPGYSNSFLKNLSLFGRLDSSIKSEKINDEKCYKITFKLDDTIKTVWLTKSRGFPIKSEIKFSNGDILEYNYDLKFYITTLRNVEFPDVSEYTYYDYETGIEISNPMI